MTVGAPGPRRLTLMNEALLPALLVALLTACAPPAPAVTSVATRIAAPAPETVEAEDTEAEDTEAEDTEAEETGAEETEAQYAGPEVVECGCGCCGGAALEVRCVATEAELEAKRREQRAARARPRCRAAGCSPSGVAWRLCQPDV